MYGIACDANDPPHQIHTKTNGFLISCAENLKNSMFFLVFGGCLLDAVHESIKNTMRFNDFDSTL